MEIPKKIKEEIEKIVASYPNSIHASPRSAFEQQLKQHLENSYKKKK